MESDQISEWLQRLRSGHRRTCQAHEMGPCLGVYVLSDQRDQAMIQAFVEHYTTSGTADFADRRVELLPLGYSGDPDSDDRSSWEEHEIESVEALVDVALMRPWRSFVCYLDRLNPWCGALISATPGREIVFGVSVNDPMGAPETLTTTATLLAELRSFANATHGWVVGEEPPPFDPRVEQPWNQSWAVQAFSETSG